MNEVKREDENLTLFSPLSPLELAAKMRCLIGAGRRAQPIDNIIGSGSEQEMTLSCYHDDSTPAVRFHATLEPYNGGTRIMGRFKKNPVPRSLIFFFIIFGGLFFALGIGMFLDESESKRSAFIFMMVPIVLGATLIFIQRVMHSRAVTDHDEICRFLSEHCEAR